MNYIWSSQAKLVVNYVDLMEMEILSAYFALMFFLDFSMNNVVAAIQIERWEVAGLFGIVYNNKNII